MILCRDVANPDQRIWGHYGSGQFTTRSAYELQVASWLSIALKDGSCFFTLQVAEASVQVRNRG